VFKAKTRDEWCSRVRRLGRLLRAVLTFSEARAHPHNVARASFVPWRQVEQPLPRRATRARPAAIAARRPSAAKEAALRSRLGLFPAQVERMAALGLGCK
jgi:alpha-methylacyl-CoA racemase